MNKLLWILAALTQIIFNLCPICFACSQISSHSGTLTESSGGTYNTESLCWILKVPEDHYARFEVHQMSISDGNCQKAYLKIEIRETKQTYSFCSSSSLPITALSDAVISYHHSGSDDWYRSSSFSLYFKKESLTCAQSNHFRCSSSYCVHQSKVCDRVLDCENGVDEGECNHFVDGFKAVPAVRNRTVAWLKKQWSLSKGWGRDTPRAISALYLGGGAKFRAEGNLEEGVMVKQLELQTAVALMRNSTEPMTVNELCRFINALVATCHNPRMFYGFDLALTLRDRIDTYSKPCPGAYLTLCSLNWPFSEDDVLKMLDLLENDSKHPFLLDIQAMALMALGCMKKKMANFETIANASEVYNSTIQRFISGQLPDGSFGHVYTTALITQALIASGEERNLDWKVNSTAEYLVKQLSSISENSTSETVDFLSVYLILPTLKHNSLANLDLVDCVNVSRKQRHYQLHDESQISDILLKLEKKVQIQYSLYVGDQKAVIHTIYVTVPQRSTVYDVMRMAQTVDPKYKFEHRDTSDGMYIYDIGGIKNDPEEGKFWLLYVTLSPSASRTLVLHTESPDQLFIEEADHVVMWYKTAKL